MGRGDSVYLSWTALVLLAAVSPSSAGLWTVDIDESPAPPPDKGPPFSAHATRNRAVLPYEIIGVVGAYVGSVLILGTLLLTVGRSLRKKAQTMAVQPKEMVKPLPRAFEASPISPQSNRSWFSPKGMRSKKSLNGSIRSGVSNNAMSPGAESVVSFDNSVIEADRARRQEEMERLYAAVMAQDENNASKPNLAPNYGGPPPEYSGNGPPRLITDAPGMRHLQVGASYPQSPTTPKSPVRAIYPPGSSVPPGPMSPTSPINAGMPNYSMPQSQQPDSDLRTNRHRRTASGSSGQASTNTSAPTKLRKSLRNIKISAPIIRDDNSDGARTPLSPRFYTDPGVPPEPPTARTAETLSPGYPPSTPGSINGWQHQRDQDNIDEIRDLPQANPQRAGAYVYNNPAQIVTNTASTRPDPTRSAPSANNSGTLPFREMNRQYAAQQAQSQQAATAAFPLSPGHWNATSPNTAGFGYITSAGPVKTTFLEARRDRLGPGPRTGQATPYSPYMPYTPLTPVTPHLPSRAERKQREKEERKLKGAITEEEQVADEKDLWSSGY